MATTSLPVRATCLVLAVLGVCCDHSCADDLSAFAADVPEDSLASSLCDDSSKQHLPDGLAIQRNVRQLSVPHGVLIESSLVNTSIAPVRYDEIRLRIGFFNLVTCVMRLAFNHLPIATTPGTAQHTGPARIGPESGRTGITREIKRRVSDGLWFRATGSWRSVVAFTRRTPTAVTEYAWKYE